jgi:hypothetical protein
VEVEKNMETPDLVSLPIRFFVWNISTNPTNLSPDHLCGVNYSTNPAANLGGVLYFGIFFKKLYLLYIGTEGVHKPQYENCNLKYSTHINQRSTEGITNMITIM